MASDEARGRSEHRSLQRRLNVFRTVDRSRSSHAYSTALSTPPSQEGKNHPARPAHPFGPLSRDREKGDGIETERWLLWYIVQRSDGEKEIPGGERETESHGKRESGRKRERRGEPTGEERSL